MDAYAALRDAGVGHFVSLSKLEDSEIAMIANGARVTVGRSPSCDVRVDDMRVSQRHAWLRCSGEGVVTVTDTSRNGLWVDGMRVARNCPTVVGDGSSILVVNDVRSASLAGAVSCTRTRPHLP